MFLKLLLQKAQKNCASIEFKQTVQQLKPFFLLLFFISLFNVNLTYATCQHEIEPPLQIVVCVGEKFNLNYDLCEINIDSVNTLCWYAQQGGNTIFLGSQTVLGDGTSIDLSFGATGTYTVYFYLVAFGGNCNPTQTSINTITVTVIDTTPQGIFTPPFVSCHGHVTYVKFNSSNSTSQNLDLANSYINFGDGSGNQTLSPQMWIDLTGVNGLVYNSPNNPGNYTVTLYLENACGGTTFT